MVYVRCKTINACDVYRSFVSSGIIAFLCFVLYDVTSDRFTPHMSPSKKILKSPQITSGSALSLTDSTYSSNSVINDLTNTAGGLYTTHNRILQAQLHIDHWAANQSKLSHPFYGHICCPSGPRCSMESSLATRQNTTTTYRFKQDLTKDLL